MPSGKNLSQRGHGLRVERPGRSAMWLILIVLAAGRQGSPAEEPAPIPPVITSQPRGGLAAVGEDYQMDVDFTGTPPFTFRWLRDGKGLPDQTNQVLLLTNLTRSQSGAYMVQVRNAAGTTTSSRARLYVVTNTPRYVVNGPVFGTDHAEVQINLAGNGFENFLSFSVGFNQNAVTAPTFVAANPAVTLNVDQSLVGEGLIGLEMSLPPEVRFARAYQSLGVLRFDFLSATNPFQAGLYFTNTPMPIVARDTRGTDLSLAAEVLPALKVIEDFPRLNLQSGLFEHQIYLGNPGARPQWNVGVGVYDLGVDTLGWTISLYNFWWQTTVDWDLDGLAETSADGFRIASVAPGQFRNLMLTYYVADHRTTPVAKHFVQSAEGRNAQAEFPDEQASFVINSVRVMNDTLVLEFQTISNLVYYIQYAETLSQLDDPAAIKTVPGRITGTGGLVRWSESKPPETELLSERGCRFYRVLQMQP